MTVFERDYAAAYDAVYADKDYARECELALSHAGGPVQRVIDLGCGTGGHAVVLAERGVAVTGVDRSEDMLRLARERVAKLDATTRERITLIRGDVRSVTTSDTFDLALMMFAVLSYQLSDDDVIDALESARAHLRPGGRFIADLWWGPAVLSQKPSQRTRVIPTRDGEIIRISDGKLDQAAQCVDVTITLHHILREQRTAVTTETHRMRYFHPRELALLLRAAGLREVALRAFPDVENAPSERSWSALLVAEPA